ncbi:dehydrogenase/reductase SDR family member 11-like isoform X2 [Ruditapes philippinarum]|uniref:dehydrogenase/reductase SDR family member 11-like isoform X2 n=1 Tax=Ruditapes philippinarum TaxID=129788 RepID=UPI00295AD895|nr:dehydrogenase/reductase SDR family member 11-like isoform X2 [Ruditapes philippinarum]
MERWVGRVALVTGASSGIGKAIAQSLVCHGMKVVGCARNVEAVEELSEKLKAEKGSLIPIVCDVSKEEQVLSMFEKIKSEFGGTDVCINNAGLSQAAPLLSGKTEQWKNMLDVNVLGLCMCTREAVKSMRERGVDDGHVIQINSGVGHKQYASNPDGHFYSATKFAVTALVDGLRNELSLSKTHIRVTSISPGLTETNFAHRMYVHDPQVAVKKYSAFESLKPVDIADGVIYALSAPKHVQVHEVKINPTEQP